MENDSRKYYLDMLRILASFTVIVLHVSSTYMDKLDSATREYFWLSQWNCITHWAVGMFVMISGALFLGSNKNVSIQRLYKHNIGHIVKCFILWSLGYTLLTVFTNGQKDNMESFLTEFIKGHYHMWFLYMIIGVYMMIPLIKPVAKDMVLTRYFCFFIVIFGFLIPSIDDFLRGFGILDKSILLVQFSKSIETLRLKMPTSYLGYFVIGYYLSKGFVKEKSRMLLYLGGIISFFMLLGSPFLTKITGINITFVGSDFSIITLLFSSSLFVWMKENFKIESDKLKNCIYLLSSVSFGVYLIHAAVIEILDHPLGINAVMIHPFAGVVLVSILVAGIAFISISIMKKIPIIRDFI